MAQALQEQFGAEQKLYPVTGTPISTSRASAMAGLSSSSWETKGKRSGVEVLEKPTTVLESGCSNVAFAKADGIQKPLVSTAALECTPQPLSQQIYEFAYQAAAAGKKRVRIIPLFLMRGIHVMEDIPTEIAAARKLGLPLDIEVEEAIGSHPEIGRLLAERFEMSPTEGRILIAHGSRRVKGNRGIEQLGRQLGVTVAYWATMPNLETQIIQLMQQGCQTLTIFPYFLFAGGITDSIIHLTEEMAERFPRIRFRVLPPLGATPELAQLLAKL